jgi:hypothetical protein
MLRLSRHVLRAYPITSYGYFKRLFPFEIRHYEEKTLIIRRRVRETFEVSRTLKSSCTKFFRIMSIRKFKSKINQYSFQIF